MSGQGLVEGSRDEFVPELEEKGETVEPDLLRLSVISSLYV